MRILIVILLLAAIGCAKNSSPATGNTAVGNGCSGCTNFTANDIVKNWKSACTALADGVIGSSYYQSYLDLANNGTFTYQQYMFDGNNPGLCANPDYYVVFSVAGTYTVGSVVTGSAQAITFTIDVAGNVPAILISTGNGTPALATTQDAFSSDCGGTSPYCTLVAGNCVNNNSYASGQWADSQHMNCMHYEFPNTGNNTIYNVGTYGGGTLTLGAGAEGVPGVFTLGARPNVATVPFN